MSIVVAQHSSGQPKVSKAEQAIPPQIVAVHCQQSPAPGAVPHSLKPPKQTKERLVAKFTQDIGGVASYWNHIPAAELRALDDVLQEHPEVKGAIANLIQQLQDAKQTNTRVNQRNFGLNQTAAKHERTADRLTQANAQLEKEKNELIKQIHNLVATLTNYENSELRQAVIRVRNFIAGMIQP